MLRWERKWWTDLTVDELHEILALRQSVFIVEQQCPYADIDGLDPKAWHVLGRTRDGPLVAYLRIAEPREKLGEPVIGRVVVHVGKRGHGFGRDLMNEGLRHSARLFPGKAVRLSAQAYLQRFYESFGFVQNGAVHLEDGIPHVDMIKRSQNRDGVPRDDD